MKLTDIIKKLVPSYGYFKELYLALLIILSIAFVGSFGYVYFEGYTYIEALYMTIITVSTVGFNEVRPLSDEGRIFTMFLIITSFGTFAYAISSLSKYVITGAYAQYFKKYKMDKHIDKLEGHIVICGAGNNGAEAIRNLQAHKKEIVVIETDERLIESLKHKNMLYIQGDATDEDILLSAGIKNASALITTLPKDTDNVFVVLTAREFNSEMRIVSRCAADSSRSKLKSAGATNIILPDKVGGARMAGFVVNQNVNRFLDKIALTEIDESFLTEFQSSEFPEEIQRGTVSHVLDFLDSSSKLIGMRTADGIYIVNPEESSSIPGSCELFFLGTTEEIKQITTKIKGH